MLVLRKKADPNQALVEPDCSGECYGEVQFGKCVLLRKVTKYGGSRRIPQRAGEFKIKEKLHNLCGRQTGVGSRERWE
jgi:hypothetical protein